jgi:hypothetical protein
LTLLRLSETLASFPFPALSVWISVKEEEALGEVYEEEEVIEAVNGVEDHLPMLLPQLPKLRSSLPLTSKV